MNIALYGAGMMGSGMAERWLRTGNAVAVWNRTPQKARALERFGATVHEDPVAASRGAEAAHLILSDDAAVDAVLNRIVDALPKGLLVVDHTTVSPRGAAERAARLDAAGLQFLHAPVFMSPQACREGKGLMLVSGPSARVEKARAHLSAMTGELWYVGEETNRAAAMKLFGNAMIATIVAGLSDVYAMAKATGIRPADAHAVFDHFKVANTLDIRGKKMAQGDFSPSFELTMARKDVRLMLETAEQAGVPLHFLPAIAERMDEMIARGYGDKDLGVLSADALV